jgi:predicted RNA-binding protein YlxR (DUF448 family)
VRKAPCPQGPRPPKRERVSRAAWKAASKARRKASPAVPIRSCCVCRTRKPSSELIFLNPFMTSASPGRTGPSPPGKGGGPPRRGPSPARARGSRLPRRPPDPPEPQGLPPDPAAAPSPAVSPVPLGRGAWVCRSEACLARLHRKGALDHAFRGRRKLLPGAMERLSELLAADGGREPPSGPEPSGPPGPSGLPGPTDSPGPSGPPGSGREA